MKKSLSILLFLLLTHTLMGQVSVELDFGNEKLNQVHQVNWQEGMTVLDALRYCVPIQSKPTKQYLFVTEIDGVKNIPFEKAWYYKINAKDPEQLASKQLVEDGDVIQWIYKKDTCSYDPPKATIEIRFGAYRPSKICQVIWEEGMTVEDALQQSATIDTYPIQNKYVFVSGIDSIKSIPQQSYWMYSVNGKNAKKQASSVPLNQGDYIVWEYRVRNQQNTNSEKVCGE